MLKIHKPGFFTSLQDRGRFHYRDLGVPVSGALDQSAMSRANALLENEADNAVLEITMQGPELEFEQPTFMVMCGAPLEAELDGEPIQMDKVYRVNEGAVLQCGHVLQGFRTYLAVRGGFLSDKKLGSRSQYYPVTRRPVLVKAMEIPYKACNDFEPKLLKWSAPGHFGEKELRVYPAPEFQQLSQLHKNQIFDGVFQLAKEHNRMACQLQPSIDRHSIQMITSATLPGTVQLTPAGRLIILMRDGQTTGGYPRILQMDMESQDLLSQKRFGDSVSFKMVKP
ncbi:MAG: biotin-dependent carboxyltransferase family protein [Robiginitalea sp.]